MISDDFRCFQIFYNKTHLHAGLGKCTNLFGKLFAGFIKVEVKFEGKADFEVSKF
jgi:hypothetical protein